MIQMAEKRQDLSYYQSPLGLIRIVTSEKGLLEVDFTTEVRDKTIKETMVASSSIIRETILQLDEYFARTRTEFTLPLDLIGTSFQIAVWEELLKIPYGKTKSYSDIAQAIGKPKAQRAVGMANNKNPISIIVPCHRVIGKNGSLTGYAKGLHHKEFLLKLEKSI